MTVVCAACPVDRGACPKCGTFWIIDRDGPKVKRYGVRPVPQYPNYGPANLRPTLAPLVAWPNVVKIVSEP